MNKTEYKVQIKSVLRDIEENIDNLVDYAFSKHTTGIEIKINIEPLAIVTWDAKFMYASFKYAGDEEDE